MNYMMLRVAQEQAGVPGLAITLPLVAIVLFGIWLIIDTARAERAERTDPYQHEFKADCPWGPVQRCAEWVEDADGNEVRCGLDRTEHRFIYGDVYGQESSDA